MTTFTEERDAATMTIQTEADTPDVVMWSTEELCDAVDKCEKAISDGTAQIRDFELFALCQQELSRRA